MTFLPFLFSREFPTNILMVGNEIGRLPPQFQDASKVANAIMDLGEGFEFDQGRMFYNQFKSVVSYKTREIEIFPVRVINEAEKLTTYDSIDADVLQSYAEYSLASLIYYALKEGACSEQSSRMTAMDSSSKNAGETSSSSKSEITIFPYLLLLCLKLYNIGSRE